MFFTYFYNIVKFQTCSWLQNYVITAYKTIHLTHFLICVKSASELRIACVRVLQKKELPLCVCYICLFFSPFSVSIEVERGGGRGGEDLQ